MPAAAAGRLCVWHRRSCDMCVFRGVAGDTADLPATSASLYIRFIYRAG